MKSEFAFIALPITALVAPSTFAVQYLTVDQAQRAIFPGKSLTAVPVKLAPAQRKAIEQASFAKKLQMARYARLALPEDLSQLADGELAAGAEDDEPQTSRLGHRA